MPAVVAEFLMEEKNMNDGKNMNGGNKCE